MSTIIKLYISSILFVFSFVYLSAKPYDYPQYYPQPEQLIERDAYTLLYSSEHKSPRWVFDHLVASDFIGDAKRERFRSDSEILQPSRSKDKDYRGSGWSRGHNAGSGNHKNNQDLTNQTFLLSNICPQDIYMNSNICLHLEDYCQQQIIQSNGDGFVVTGSVYLSEERNGVSIVTYEEIGDGVSVPTHMFKILMVRDEHQKIILVEAYLIPNSPLHDEPFEKYKITIPKLKTKITLQLPDIYESSANFTEAQNAGAY